MALFDHVPRRVLEVVAANVDEVRVPAGETLIREGHRNDAFWIVMEGEAEMSLGHRKRHIGPASADQFRALESDETVALRLFHYALERLREDLESA